MDRDIRRYIDDISITALNELLFRITDDPFLQEAYVASVRQTELDLAGDNPTSLIMMLARNASQAYLESYAADTLFFRKLGETGLSDTGDIRKWRSQTHRRLMSVIKTLAFVRRVEPAAIENTLNAPQDSVKGPIRMPTWPVSWARRNGALSELNHRSHGAVCIDVD